MDTDVRQRIVDEARSWLGVPFRPHGRTRRGIDCVNLVLLVTGEVVGVPADIPGYTMEATPSFAFRAANALWDRITDEEAGPGDIVLMNYCGRTIHIGLLSDRGIIHAAQIPGRVVERPLTPKHSVLQPVAYYRIKGVPPWRNLG